MRTPHVLLSVLLALTPAFAACDSFEKQVAKDAEKEYEIAKRVGGDLTTVCVQAGLVAVAWLQANDEANFKKWAAQERSDCAAAGVK